MGIKAKVNPLHVMDFSHLALNSTPVNLFEARMAAVSLTHLPFQAAVTVNS